METLRFFKAKKEDLSSPIKRKNLKDKKLELKISTMINVSSHMIENCIEVCNRMSTYGEKIEHALQQKRI